MSNVSANERLQARVQEIERILENGEVSRAGMDFADSSRSSTSYFNGSSGILYNNYDNINTTSTVLTSDSGIRINDSSIYTPYRDDRFDDYLDDAEILRLEKKHCPFAVHSEQAKLWKDGFRAAAMVLYGAQRIRSYNKNIKCYDDDNLETKIVSDSPQEPTNENEEEGFDIEEEDENEVVGNETQDVQ